MLHVGIFKQLDLKKIKRKLHCIDDLDLKIRLEANSFQREGFLDNVLMVTNSHLCICSLSRLLHRSSAY